MGVAKQIFNILVKKQNIGQNHFFYAVGTCDLNLRMT